MVSHNQTPAAAEYKNQARTLQKEFAAQGKSIKYSQALEIVSHQHGFRDWNTLSAFAQRTVGHNSGDYKGGCPITVGQRISGQYLGQAFCGEVLGVQKHRSTDRYRVTLEFDKPVDVVRFDSFSSYRRRVTCMLSNEGKTLERTSDGNPQLSLNM